MNIELTEKQKNIVSIIKSGGQTILFDSGAGQSTILSKLIVDRVRKRQKTRIIAGGYAMSVLANYILSMVSSSENIIADRCIGGGVNRIAMSIDGELFATVSEGSSYQSYLEDDELVLIVGVHDCEFINSPPKGVLVSRLFRLMDVNCTTLVNPLICWEQAVRERWLLSEHDPRLVNKGYEMYIKRNVDACESLLNPLGFSLNDFEKV